MWNASRFCVSSLRRGHANLLCIVPILVYVLPKQERSLREFRPYLYCILAEKALGNFKDVQDVRGGFILRVPLSTCLTNNVLELLIGYKIRKTISESLSFFVENTVRFI